MADSRNPYEGPDAEDNIERDLAVFKAVNGMSTATEYLINMISALKNARTQITDLEKTERAYAVLCVDYGDACRERDDLRAKLLRANLELDAVKQHRDLCNDVVKERDAHIATLEAELAAAKVDGEHQRYIAERARAEQKTSSDHDLALMSKIEDNLARVTAELQKYRNGVGDLNDMETLKEHARCATKYEAERDAAIKHRAAINEEIKKLHGVIKTKGFSVEDSVSLYETRKALKELLERDQVLAVALVEWTNFDVTEFEISKALGVTPQNADQEWLRKHKYVFWSANNVGDGLSDIMHALVKIGRIEKDDGIRFRWRNDFDIEVEAQKDD